MLRALAGQARSARHVPGGRVDPAARRRAIAGRGARPWPSCISRAGASRCSRANALGIAGLASAVYQRFRSRADEIAPRPRRHHRAGARSCSKPTGRPSLPQGIIHADLFPDNVFFLGDTLSGLIDFYFACNDALAYDIAVALNAWCFETDHSFNVTKGQALLKGYQSVRAADARPSARRMPVLARGAALRFLLTRAYDWLHTASDALVRRKDPLEYLRRLKFHRSIRSASEYGLEEPAR